MNTIDRFQTQVTGALNDASIGAHRTAYWKRQCAIAVKLLKRLAKAQSWHKKRALLKLWLGSLAAKGCLLWVSLSRSFRNTPRKLDWWRQPRRHIEAALRLKPGGCLTEAVHVHLKGRHGKVRPFVTYGPLRRTQCYLVKYALEAMGVEGPLDHACPGRGEATFCQFVRDAHQEGFKFWSAPDVTNHYLSMRRAHLEELPITDRLIENVVFLAPDVPMVVHTNRVDKKLIHEWIALHLGSAPPQYGATMMHNIQEIVRRGLPQGSVLSPLVARWHLSRALKEASVPGVLTASYADNLAIGGKSLVHVAQFLKKLHTALEHSAGNLSLHSEYVGPLREVEILGYKFRPGRGHHAGHPVHTKPGSKRIAKFHRNLRKVVDEATGTKAIFLSAETYRRRWYGAQTGWTKVPRYSNELSRNITVTDVAHHLMGLKMGYPMASAMGGS